MTTEPETHPALDARLRGTESSEGFRPGIVVVAWAGLLVLHVFGVLLFAGWMGLADDFIPWSVFAFPLLLWTRHRLRQPPLLRQASGRWLMATWLVLLLLAGAGVDEGRVVWIPAMPAAAGYAVLPILGTAAVCGFALLKWRRPGRAPAAT